MKVPSAVKSMLRPFKGVYLHSRQTLIIGINSLSPATATRIYHYLTTGHNLDLRNPTTFNDKLQWLKLYWQHPLITTCADKYAVQNYVKSKCGQKLLNKTLSVFNSPHELDWDSLPMKFAIKCTHGCGYNIVTQNKNELKRQDVLKKLTRWVNERYGSVALEYHYDKIRPRILVEEYIEGDSGSLPTDYKIYCFNGKAKLVLVCSEREKELKLDFFDLEWSRLEIGLKENESSTPISKPASFEIMIDAAEKMAVPFPFVRIDFYNKGGLAIFGEMTFTPAGNMATYYNNYGQELLGSFLKLPKNSK